MNFDFHAELADLANRVRHSPQLELLSFEVRPPEPAGSLDKIEERLESPLPNSVRTLYSTMSGATLRWRFKPELDEQTRGQVIEQFAGAVTRHSLFNEAGVINIAPLADILFDEEYALPQADGDDGEFDYEGTVYTDNEFCRMLRPFDIVSDFFAMAFVVQPEREEWNMMWLSDYWIEYDSSRVVHLEDYLRYAISTWGLINAREEIFREYRGDRREPLRYDADLAEARVPTVLKAG